MKKKKFYHIAEEIRYAVCKLDTFFTINCGKNGEKLLSLASPRLAPYSYLLVKDPIYSRMSVVRTPLGP